LRVRAFPRLRAGTPTTRRDAYLAQQAQRAYQALWRRYARIPLIARDITFPCDVIRREHSPPSPPRPAGA
jgi:hypothetical protein